MQANARTLTEGPITPTLLRFALPMMAAICCSNCTTSPIPSLWGGMWAPTPWPPWGRPIP